ncbi:hypothetical protein HZC53_03980 [Candidatus Uhrbacteria bacterium]|nr:hypothetical protein [Candidatus Uhrbacteria bacterium]
MPTQPKITQPAYLLAGVLFTAIALVAIVALFMLKSKADVTTQEAGAGNTAPTVDSMYVAETSLGTDIGPAGIGAGFTTNEGLPKNIFVGGTITDLNGCHNLMQATVTLYRSGILPGVSCTPDTNNCYHTTLYFPDDFDGCDTPDDTDVTFETSFSLPNYVDPTDAGSPNEPDTWVAAVNVADNAEEQMMLQETYEVASLAAFSVPNAINYGTLALGADSNAIELTFSNTGNRDVDSDVIALHDPLAQPTPIEGDMVSNLSGFDNIAASAVHYSLSALTAWESATAVSKTASTDLALGLVQQTEDLTIPTTDTYWRLRMPAAGVQGTYTNTVVFTAKAAGVVLPLDILSSTDYSSSGGVETAYVDIGLNNTAYISSNTDNKVMIVDVSDTANPVEISTLNGTISNATAITKYGDYVYLSSQSSSNNLQIIDVSNTASPSIVSTMTVMDSGITKIVVNDIYAYVIGYDSVSGDTFKIVDVSNASSPSVVSGSGMNFTTSTGMDLQYTGGYAYVYTSDASDGYLTAVDVSNASAPTAVSTLQTYKDAKIAASLFYAFVVGNNSDFANTVQSIDISNPAEMTPVSSLTINNNTVNNVSVAGNILLVSDKGEEADSSNLALINTQNPGMMLNAATTRIGAYNVAGTTYNVFLGLNVYVAGKEDGHYYILEGPPSPVHGGGPVGFNGSVGKFASK